MPVLKALVLIIFCLMLWGRALGQDLPVLELTEEVSTRDIAQKILRAEDFEGPIERAHLLSHLEQFESVADEPNMRVASERGHSVFLLEVQNASETYGEWVFTTRRHSVNRFAIYDVTQTQAEVLVDSDEPSDNARNIRRYIGYGAVIALQPGERKTIAVYADIEALRAVPFEFYRFDPYLDEYYWQTTRFAFFLPTIFVLIFINFLFFTFLGRRYFLYLAASELSFLIVVLHAAAYLDAYGMAAFPILAIQISEIAKCGFIVFMTLFATSFLNSATEHPIFHRVLQGLLILGVALTAFWLVAGFVSKDWRVAVRAWTWVYSAGGSLIFPVIGVMAVRRYGIHFVPLAIGWSAVAMVGLYILAHVLFPPLFGMPGIMTILSIIGWQEAIFVTLSAVWKSWKDNQDQQRTTEAYAKGLEDRLQAISRANQLQEENALAVSTIQDQNAMLQSSGHDTRQVLLAINTATDVLEQGSGAKDPVLIDTLKASAAYLDDILSTTLTAKRTYSTNRTCLALSAFSVEDFFRSLNRIYQPAFGRKSLTFETVAPPGVNLISDRALLTRAVSNLIANSLQATSAGGITCEARVRGADLEITLSDTGTGMTSELLAYLMADEEVDLARPKELDRPASGFRIAKSIITQLDGDLSIETEIGRGTVIRLVLPCAHKNLSLTSTAQFSAARQVKVQDLDSDPSGDSRAQGARIGISMDDSSIMRQRAAARVDVILYKPLYLEMADHPAIEKLRSDQ